MRSDLGLLRTARMTRVIGATVLSFAKTIVAIGLALSNFPAFAQTTALTFTIQPGPENGMDTCYGTVYVTSGCPGATDLYIGGWADYYYDFFQFDLSGSPTSASTQKAELWLYGSAPHDPKMQMNRITEAWTKNNVTLSNNPASVFYKTMPPFPTTADWVVTDITDLYKSWKDGTFPNYGLKLIPTENNQTNGSIASSRSADSTHRPKLVITSLSNSPNTFTTSGQQNYSDIWWNPNESGWGLTLSDHETQMFGVWYTYRIDGAPTWFVIPGGSFSSDKRFFSGDLYQTSGPSFRQPFDPSQVIRTRVGSVNFDFQPSGVAPGIALFTYVIGTVSATKQIQRQGFGNAAPVWGTDYTDIWWNQNESGWGLSLAQHGNNIFGVWYTYGDDGQPLFVVLPTVSFQGSNSFSGTLYTTTGPYFGLASFDPTRVTRSAAGSAEITFSGTRGTFKANLTIGAKADVSTLKPIASMAFGNQVPQPRYFDDYFYKDDNYRPDPIQTRPNCPQEYKDAWGFCFKECTSYAAWKINRSTSPPFVIHDLGSARDWGEGRLQYQSPMKGDIAWWKDINHVAYVEDVDSDGTTIWVTDYNYNLKHTWAQRKLYKGVPHPPYPTAFLRFVSQQQPGAPQVTGLKPSSILGSDSPQWISISGLNFISGAKVTLAGSGLSPSSLPTSFGNSELITFVTTFGTAGGSRTIQVQNPDGQTSNVFSFDVHTSTAAAPTISRINPNPAVGSNSEQTLTLVGQNVLPGATVVLTNLGDGGVYRKPANVQSTTELSVVANLTSASTWSVQVINPDGQWSGILTLTVLPPPSAPILNSVSPNSLVASDTPQTLTLLGSGFSSGASVVMSDVDHGGGFSTTSNFINNGQLTVSATFAAASTWSVRVVNPDRQESGIAKFLVLPKLTNLATLAVNGFASNYPSSTAPYSPT